MDNMNSTMRQYILPIAPAPVTLDKLLVLRAQAWAEIRQFERHSSTADRALMDQQEHFHATGLM